jgi:ligand-binding SRPBCC domain-containing protein
MSVHVLESSQVVHASIDRAWDFFSDPRNLSRITPPELDFKILSALPERVYPGLMIEYRVRPLLGIPARWVTEITHVEPGKFFVDEQRIGPYRIWHHEHHFRPLDGGRVEMTDRVTYVLPFGPLGDLVHPFLVKPQLAKIFAFREKAVAGLFEEPVRLEPAMC